MEKWWDVELLKRDFSAQTLKKFHSEHSWEEAEDLELEERGIIPIILDGFRANRTRFCLRTFDRKSYGYLSSTDCSVLQLGARSHSI